MSNDRYLLDAAFNVHRKQYPDVSNLGEAFEIFSTDLALKRRRLSIDEIRDGIVGGGKDGGLDALYFFVNGRLINDVKDTPKQHTDIVIEVVFIQSKHSTDIEQFIIQKLNTSIHLFIAIEADQPKLDTHFNSDLQAAAALYRDLIHKYHLDEYKVFYHILYICRSSNSPTSSFNDLAKDLVDICSAQLGPASCTFQFLGASALYKMSVEPKHVRKELSVQPAGQIGNDGNYIALVKLEYFITFITTDGSLAENIFEFNVRDFEGNTKPVNKEIAENVFNPSENSNFWWYNNGVTIIASKIAYGQKALVIDDPMIVNGLQTANVLFQNRSSIVGKTNDDRRVVVRAISIDESDIRDGVVRATNSQTRLNPLSLKATEGYQRQIEEYLKASGYYYERRKNFYKNRQMPADRIIDLTRLGQSVISLNLHLPDEARGRPGTFLNKDENYRKIFPRGQNLKRFLVAAAIERNVERWFRANRKNYDALYRNNLRFHTIMVLSWIIMGKISKYNTSIDEKNITEGSIKKAFEWVSDQYRSAGGIDDKLAKTHSFTKRLSDQWTVSSIVKRNTEDGWCIRLSPHIRHVAGFQAKPEPASD